jgi:protocatechuate 3,4-dioxygenase beta subunit
MSFPRSLTIVLPLLFLAAAVWASPSQPEPSHDLNAVRALAVRIKSAQARVEAGESVGKELLDSFNAELKHFAVRASQSGDLLLAQKIRGMGTLFGNLQAAGFSSAVPALDRSRARGDVEIVSAEHGGSCHTALGITREIPVRVTLGPEGSQRSEAWFRIDTRPGESAGFKTESNGPDPAIALFSSCENLALPIAENDDALGLDASAAARSSGSTATYARIRNTGNAGVVFVDATTSLTTISGQITDAATNAPIQNALVTVHAGDLFYGGGFIYGSAYTNGGGSYLILLNQTPVSTYYVRVDAAQHVAMVYPSGLCQFGSSSTNLIACANGQTDVINLPAGTSVTDIDMALIAGLKISGTVVDKSNNPIDSAMVKIADANGTVLDYGYTNQDGAYAFKAITPATYKLGVEFASGYGYQLYDHVDCSGPLMTQCDFGDATPLQMIDSDAMNVDFQLTHLSSIAVSIADETNQPIAGQAYLMNTFGGIVAQGVETDIGAYVIGPLPAGTYYVASSSYGYFSQLYAGIDCPSDCGAQVALATPVIVSGPEETKHVALTLHAVPTVHGHVQDVLTSAPLANVTVVATQFNSINAYSTVTDGSGDYALTGVNPGTYYLVASSEDHLDQIYPSIACEFQGNYLYSPPPGCNLGGASLLTIALGQIPPAFDFALYPASRLIGHTSIRTTLPADLPAMASITLVDSSNYPVAFASSDTAGNYAINDIAPGTYYAEATLYYQGVSTTQIWESIDCAAICLPTTGAPIVVGSNSEVTGIDFALPRNDVIVGRVADLNNAPLAGVGVDLFFASNGQYEASATTDSEGYYAAPGYTGQGFLVATDAGSAYINQIHDGITCAYPSSLHAGTCSSAGATIIGLVSWSTQSPIVNFVLSSSDPLFKNGFE